MLRRNLLNLVNLLKADYASSFWAVVRAQRVRIALISTILIHQLRKSSSGMQRTLTDWTLCLGLRIRVEGEVEDVVEDEAEDEDEAEVGEEKDVVVVVMVKGGAVVVDTVLTSRLSLRNQEDIFNYL